MGRAYGAPRLRAKDVQVLGRGSAPGPVALATPPGAAHEWRLVRVTGTIVDVKRSGDRWRAELELGGARMPIVGQAGARIPVTAVAEGRRVAIVGIARRPTSTATDRRFAVLPRSSADIATLSGPARGGPAAGPASAPGAIGAQAQAAPPVPIVDLAALGEHVGQSVRVGGLVVELLADGFRLDDGTSVGTVVLSGEALDALPMLEPGDALDAVGTVVERDDIVVEVSDPASLHRVGDATLTSVTSLAGSRPSAWQATTAAQPGDADASSSAIPVLAGLVILVALLAIATAVVLGRRRGLHRPLPPRLAARLAALRGPRSGAAPNGPA
jgi:hypothetical protein